MIYKATRIYSIQFGGKQRTASSLRDRKCLALSDILRYFHDHGSITVHHVSELQLCWLHSVAYPILSHLVHL
jgi:hypothetical protein